MNISIEFVLTVISIVGSVLGGIAYLDRRIDKRYDRLTEEMRELRQILFTYIINSSAANQPQYKDTDTEGHAKQPTPY